MREVKKLSKQITVTAEAEAIAMCIMMINALSHYDAERVLKTVAAYFDKRVVQ